MKYAVIYARYSSDNQTEQSIEGQVRACKEYAERNDILVVDSYIDRAMTGTNDHRPEFQRMIKDSSKKEWDYVIVYKLDRFSRNKYESVIHRKTLKDNGVKLLSAMENIPDTPEGIILEGLLESMNQYFSAELSQKTKRGMKENRLKGYSQGGRLVYGYKKNDKKIVIDENEAAIVRYIYEKYDAGYYVNDILTMLKTKGITNRGKPFYYEMINRILSCEYYTGIYRFGDELYENMYPQIIDKDLYERTRAKSVSLRHGGMSTMVIYIFSRKLVCGHCGANLNGTFGINRHGEKYYYYRCDGRKKDPQSCQKCSVPKIPFENFIITKVVAELNKPEVMNKLLDQLLDIQNNRTDIDERIHALEQEQQQAKTSIKNMMKLIERGVSSSTIMNRIKELQEQIAKIDNDILAEKNKPIVTFTREQLQNYYDEKLKRNKREITALLINKIKLWNDKIEIVFNSPIKKNPNNNQGPFYTRTFKKSIDYNEAAYAQMLNANYYI